MYLLKMFDAEFMSLALRESVKSSDFWRQVGAVVPIDDSKLLIAFNEHMPTNMEPYIYGDMRLVMNPGEEPEICGAIHAERAIIASAACKGISLQDKIMYVTTFPCCGCAQMIARSGIRKVFFKEGYSNQQADKILRLNHVEIVRVL